MHTEPVVDKRHFDMLRERIAKLEERSLRITFEDVALSLRRLAGQEAPDCQLCATGFSYAPDLLERDVYADVRFQVACPSGSSDMSRNEISEETIDNAPALVDVSLKLSVRPASSWLYVKTHELDAPVMGYEILWAFATTTKFGAYLRFGAPRDDADAASDSPEVPKSVNLLASVLLEFREPEGLVGVIDALEMRADRVKIEEKPDGSAVLTASGLTDVGDYFLLSSLYEDAEVRLQYSADCEIQWLEIRHFGEADGVVRYDLAQVEFDKRLWGLKHHILRNPAPVTNLDTLEAFTAWLDS